VTFKLIIDTSLHFQTFFSDITSAAP